MSESREAIESEHFAKGPAVKVGPMIAILVLITRVLLLGGQFTAETLSCGLVLVGREEFDGMLWIPHAPVNSFVFRSSRRRCFS